MFSNRRVYQLLAVGFEGSQGARLVELHEAAVADYVGCQDSSEATLHSWSPWVGRLTVWRPNIHVL